MTKFKIRNNMAYASQMQFEVVRRALWVQQAKPRTMFDWKFWEKAAHDPKMTTYLNHGVKAKMCETTPLVNTVKDRPLTNAWVALSIRWKSPKSRLSNHCSGMSTTHGAPW